MAILNTSAACRAAPSRPEPSSRAGLFVRTLVAPSATTATLSCSLLPPHARRAHAPHAAALQLVVARPDALVVHSLHPPTCTLHPLCTTPLLAPALALAAVRTPTPFRDALLVLSHRARLTFLQYDDALRNLRATGSVTLPAPQGPVSQPRLLVAHPSKPLVAVASLASTISVFPVLFRPKSTVSGQVSTVRATGTVVSLAFLHAESPAVLLALIQTPRDQHLALYTVSPSDVSSPLTLTHVASLITCAAHPDDTAIARLTTTLLPGTPRPPAPPATAIAALPQSDHLFAVFLPGRVIAADASSVLVAARPPTPPATVRHPASPATPTLHPHLRTPAAPNDPPALSLPPRPPRDELPSHPFVFRRGHSGPRIPGSWEPTGSEDDGLAYLYAPPFVALEHGEENGVVTSWVDAGDHFCDAAGNGGGLYLATESGAMFALRWGERMPLGVNVFNIPSMGASNRTKFALEFVGDVGPAVSLAAMDMGLLFVANEGADGSLRRLHLPIEEHALGTRDEEGGEKRVVRTFRTEFRRRYGLEVRQEFLNLGPISDFIVASPVRSSRRKRPRAAAGSGSSHRASSMLQHGRRYRERHNEVDVEATARFHPRGSRDALGFDSQADFASEAEDKSALGHLLHGGEEEHEIVVCSGYGRFGTIRMIRPGAPVSIFASSETSFTACNNMWPVRFTTDSSYDAGLVLTFAQGTGILYSVPISAEEQRGNEVPAVAKLVDGTDATGIRSNCRSLAVDVLEDGILAQVHSGGIRILFLRTSEGFPFDGSIENGALKEPIYETTMDWAPADGFISVGTIGAGFILICVVRGGQQKPLLCLLKLFPGDAKKGLLVVSSAELECELSCAIIPEWTTVHSDLDISSPCFPPMAILGTYAPSVEVRLLGPTMDVLDRRSAVPWSLSKPDSSQSQTKSMADKSRDGGIQRHADDEDGTETLLEYSKTRVLNMTAVPESLCAPEIDTRKMVFVGLRDGSVMCFSLGETDPAEMMLPGSPSATGHLLLEAHRKLGHRPVVLKTATVAVGKVILAQTERPWMCSSLGCAKMRWIPLAFPGTTALSSYSVPGAERCFAAVAEDAALNICGLRRISEVSVQSLYVGATPRKVLAVSDPEKSLVVATSKSSGHGISSSKDVSRSPAKHSEVGNILAELRVYDRMLGLRTGSTRLYPGEEVHVLLNWLGFIVVGTSCDLRPKRSSGVQKICNCGRLLLFSLQKKEPRAGSSSTKRTKTRLSLCSEVILPGAILAGAAHPTANILLVSCNEEVIVFGAPRSKSELVEMDRVTVRSLVVGISISDNIVCIVDRKDSVGFFVLSPSSGQLVRDRSDHRRRIVSDVVMADETLAVAVDRHGAFFSIGYAEGDGPRSYPNSRPEVPGIYPLFEANENLDDADETMEDVENAGAGSAGVSIGTSAGGENFGLQGAMESGNVTGTDGQDAQLINAPPQNGGQAQQTNAATGAGTANDSDSESGASTGAALIALLEAATQLAGTNTTTTATATATATTTATATATATATTTTTTTTMATAAEANVLVEEPNVPVPGLANPFDMMLNQADATLPLQPSPSRRGDGAPIPPNLKCHHSFNLNDTALRIRIGSFHRRERAEELGLEAKRSGNSHYVHRKEPFFESCSAAVFCGTLGGALIAAVHVPPDTYALLSKVERELSVHPDVVGPAVGSSHEKYRSVFGSQAKGTLDGDLLDLFDTLNRSAKQDIAAKVGYGEGGVLYIEAIIRELFDRVS